jgi:hypothetical protein
LESDSQIAELCHAETCDEIICNQCWGEGVRHCVRHTPDREERWERAQQAYQSGEYRVLVKGSSARLQEVNFLNRIQNRVTGVDTLVHPLTNEVLTIDDWDALLERGDQRAQIMQLLSKVVLDAKTTGRTPLNAWMRWQVPRGKRQKGQTVEIFAQSLSHIATILKDGYDTQAFTDEDLTPHLLRIAQETEESRSVTLAVLAATTGWDESARKVILGETPGTAFAHRHVFFYLFDPLEGELIYNPRDDRLRGYAELFAPLLPSEEIDEAVTAIQNELVTHDSITLEYAKQTMPYPQDALQKAFERLAATGNYALTQVPELGAALVRT